MKNKQDKYIEWLSCIANTRLMFNTVEQLETFLDAPSIRSNGVKRCFNSLQRIRSAFRDLAGETLQMTDGNVRLDQLMQDYKEAWDFYDKNLTRRVNPLNIVQELFQYHFSHYVINDLKPSKCSIFQKIEEKNISIPFIILFLMKALPGYNSKNGDVTDINATFADVLDLLDKCTQNCGVYTTLPALIAAKEEPNKCRLMLVYHVKSIFDTYATFIEQSNIYGATDDLKDRLVDLKIEGFWNENDGKPNSTQFWQIENAENSGSYFAILWKKNSENKLSRIRYTMFLIEGCDDKLIAYLQHPNSMIHRLNGEQLADADQVWYQTNMPKDETPSILPLSRILPSCFWQKELKLTKVNDEKTIESYQHWIKNCWNDKSLENDEYEFYLSLYAITQTHLYISTGVEHEYFKIPKSSFEGFDQIKIDDNVGIIKLGEKQYLAFDEFLLYLPITKSVMQKYKITKVSDIE